MHTTTRKHASPLRKQAAIMPVRRNFSGGGPACHSNGHYSAGRPARRNVSEGGPACYSYGQCTAGRFTNIVTNTALMGSNEDYTLKLSRKNGEICSNLLEEFNSNCPGCLVGKVNIHST